MFIPMREFGSSLSNNSKNMLSLRKKVQIQILETLMEFRSGDFSILLPYVSTNEIWRIV